MSAPGEWCFGQRSGTRYGRSDNLPGLADPQSGARYVGGMTSLADPDIRAFLSHGTRTGKLGWTAADGRPLVAPIWFLVEDDTLVFNTGATTAKGRAFARDQRVALCVDLQEPPYGFVQVQGSVTMSEDAEELLRTAPPRSPPGTWAPTGPRSSAAATRCPASWWCGCTRAGWSPPST